jgi:carbon storage regulator
MPPGIEPREMSVIVLDIQEKSAISCSDAIVGCEHVKRRLFRPVLFFCPATTLRGMLNEILGTWVRTRLTEFCVTLDRQATYAWCQTVDPSESVPAIWPRTAGFGRDRGCPRPMGAILTQVRTLRKEPKLMRPEDFQRSSSTTLSPPLGVRRSVNRMSTPEPVEEKPSPKKLGGLVLTRHLGESIMIGDEVEVEVVGLKAGSARLKIVAPRTIAVHRREVFDEIKDNPLPSKFAPTSPDVPAIQANRPGKPRGGLVLTRNVFESIMIGDDVEIAVVEVRPTTVKLKIVAPRTVAVHRREVYEAIQGGQG